MCLRFLRISHLVLELFCSFLIFSIFILCIRKLMPCPFISLKWFWNCPNSFGPFRTGPKNNFSLLNITFWTVSKCLFLSKTIWTGPKSFSTYTSKRHYSTVCIKTLKSRTYHQQINGGRGRKSSTGCNSDIWKKVQVNILKEPLLVLKQTKHQRKALDFSFNMAPWKCLYL